MVNNNKHLTKQRFLGLIKEKYWVFLLVIVLCTVTCVITPDNQKVLDKKCYKSEALLYIKNVGNNNSAKYDLSSKLDSLSESPDNVRYILNSYMETSYLKKLVNTKLLKDGYKKLNSKKDYVKYNDTTAVLIVNGYSLNKKRSIELANVYANIFQELLNKELNYTKIIVASEAKTATVSDNAGTNTSSFAMKNLFIVAIYACVILLILLLMIRKDDKIRSEKDMASLDGINYWGKIGGKDNPRVAIYLQSYATKENIYLVNSENANATQKNTIEQFINENSEFNFGCIDNYLTDTDTLRSINKNSDYVIVICKNTNKFSEVAQLNQVLVLLANKPIGCIYVD